MSSSKKERADEKEGEPPRVIDVEKGKVRLRMSGRN